MTTRVSRPDVRAGYDRWSASYDVTPNPLVALDRRHTLALLRPSDGERILDAACGTGVYLAAMLAAGSLPVGLDLSRGMLRAARRRNHHVDVAQADLNEELPVRRGTFDAAVCALVGEHLADLRHVFAELARSLRVVGRLVFSVFHPELAAAGIEANFEHAGVEYRLGAHRHTVADYLNAMDRAGFRKLAVHEFYGDAELATQVPAALKYLGRPLLLAIEAVPNAAA